jgi:hypothetical protein
MLYCSFLIKSEDIDDHDARWAEQMFFEPAMISLVNHLAIEAGYGRIQCITDCPILVVNTEIFTRLDGLQVNITKGE